MSVSVGVPPATVTAELRLSVSGTVLPALRSPLEGDSAIELITGVVVSICGPVCVRPVSKKFAALPDPSFTVAPLRLTAVAASAAVFWPAPTV